MNELRVTNYELQNQSTPRIFRKSDLVAAGWGASRELAMRSKAAQMPAAAPKIAPAKRVAAHHTPAPCAPPLWSSRKWRRAARNAKQERSRRAPIPQGSLRGGLAEDSSTLRPKGPPTSFPSSFKKRAPEGPFSICVTVFRSCPVMALDCSGVVTHCQHRKRDRRP